jgi:hypothetical protein
METFIHAALARPVVVTGPTQLAGIEIVAKNGDRFVVVLSGEGMKGLIQDMQSFLDDNPRIAETKSQPRQ